MKNAFKRRKKIVPPSTAQLLEVVYAGRSMTFPMCWERVTLKQFNAFYQGETVRATLEAFASDIDVLHMLGAGEEAQILNRLSFRNEIPDFISLPVPTHFDGIEFKNDIGECTLLQKWALDAWLGELAEEPNFINASRQVLAIYLYPVLTGEPLTDLTQAQQSTIMDRIDALPCLYAITLAAFFLSKYVNLTPSGAITYHIDYRPQPPSLLPKPWYRRLMSILSFRRSTPLPPSAI